MKSGESEQGKIEEFYILAASPKNNVLSVSSGHADQNRDPNERGRRRDGSVLAAESPTSGNPSRETPQSEEVIPAPLGLAASAFQALCTEVLKVPTRSGSGQQDACPSDSSTATLLGEPKTEISKDSLRQSPCTGSSFQGNDQLPDPPIILLATTTILRSAICHLWIRTWSRKHVCALRRQNRNHLRRLQSKS